jgi:hypothetical protein
MHSNIVATREFSWAPSLGVLGGNDVHLGTSNANIDRANLEEGSGDSKDVGISNLETDMSRMVDGVNISSNSNIKSSGKRKERDPSKVRGRKKKTSRIGVQLLSRWDQLLKSMSTRSDSTSLNMDRQGCSIHEVTTELHSIPGVLIDDDFHDFAAKYLI